MGQDAQVERGARCSKGARAEFVWWLAAGSLPWEGEEDQGFGSAREIRANGGGGKRERKGQ